MSDKTKEQIKAALIAAVVGAVMTFLSTLMQGLGNIDFGVGDNLVAGGASATTYLRMMLSKIA